MSDRCYYMSHNKVEYRYATINGRTYCIYIYESYYTALQCTYLGYYREMKHNATWREIGEYTTRSNVMRAFRDKMK